ncbi:hypothetical protein [Parasitella parasitica]|uniref:Uncharacterized protein n=1 Tax=Parasitella parasitica TaxID=35722 RepID=A0A0B7N6J1_9FUNG|nr:hypothetical protein [Parasitella parasitica]
MQEGHQLATFADNWSEWGKYIRCYAQRSIKLLLPLDEAKTGDYVVIMDESFSIATYNSCLGRYKRRLEGYLQANTVQGG